MAETLSAIAEQGPPGFYQGRSRKSSSRRSATPAASWTLDDLKSYQAVIRAPMARHLSRIRHRLDAAALVGGVVLLEILNILEGFPIADMKQGAAASLHVMIEAMNAPMPIARTISAIRLSSMHRSRPLIAKDYAAKRGQHRPRPRHAVGGGVVGGPAARGQQHTHYSVVDSRGNAVSNTYTLISLRRRPRRSRHRRALNNELDDFTAAPGAPTPLAS